MKNNIAKSNINIDLSSKSDSFTSYLIKHISDLDKKSYDEIVELVKDSKNHATVSDAYIAQVLSKIVELRNTRKIIRYLADIILKGSKLGVV